MTFGLSTYTGIFRLLQRQRLNWFYTGYTGRYKVVEIISGEDRAHRREERATIAGGDDLCYTATRVCNEIEQGTLIILEVAFKETKERSFTRCSLVLSTLSKICATPAPTTSSLSIGRIARPCHRLLTCFPSANLENSHKLVPFSCRSEIRKPRPFSITISPPGSIDASHRYRTSSGKHESLFVGRSSQSRHRGDLNPYVPA